MPATAEDRCREYPASALYLDCGPFELADTPADAERIPVQMLIRSNEGVERWGETWYHDFSGVRKKASVPIDYLHDAEQVIGYLDTFEEKRDGLWASGYLVPFGDDAIVPRIVHQARAGVPYEASIYFGGNGMRIEEVSQGAKAEVNGKTVNGPATIFREWPLRGVAICPYGADSQTRTKLHATGEERIQVQLTNPQEETVMTRSISAKRGLFAGLAALFGTAAELDDDVVEAVPATDQPEDEAAEPETPAAGAEGTEKPDAAASKPADDQAQTDRDRGKRFVDAFGPDGAVWYLQGKSFEEAAQLRIQQLTEERDGLNQRLASIDRGAEEPAEFQAADEDLDEDAKRSRHFAGRIGPGLGAFAASLKLPARRNGAARN